MPGNPKKREKKVKNRKPACKRDNLLKDSDEREEETSQRVFVAELIFMFSGLVIGALGMSGLQSNYINAYVLTITILISTIPLSEIALYKIKEYSKKYSYTPDILLDRFIVYLGVLGLCAALIININNVFSSYSHTINAELTFKTNNKKRSRNSTYIDYKLYVKYKNRELELNCSGNMWYDLEKGDKIPIRYYSGFLGADFIKYKN